MLKKMTGRWRRAAVAVTSVVATLGVGIGAAAAVDGQIGIDISRYQHQTSINWNQVKATGVKFTFIKATEGTTYTNSYFAGDWAATGSLGIYHGAYHFARPSLGSAAAQARYFVRVAGTQQAAGDLPPVLDLEATGGLNVTQLRKWVRNWLTTTQSLTGRDPIIYVSPYFWETYLGNSTAFHAYPLWIAEYGVSAPIVPGGWPTWTFWQGSSSGKVTGISGAVDMDSFNGNLAGLRRMANIATTTAPAPVPSPTVTAAPTTKPTATASPKPTSSTSPKPTASPTRTTSPKPTASTAPTPSPKPTATASPKPSATATATTSPTPKPTAAASPSPTRSLAPAPVPTPSATPTSTRPAVAAAPAGSALTVRSPRSTVHGRQTLQLRERLTDSAGGPLAGRDVRVFRKRPGAGRWTLVRVATTAANGAAEVDVRPVTTFVYKAIFLGGKSYQRAVSPWWRITVRR